MTPLFHNTEYVKSAHYWHDLPPEQFPEIAFAGRSNAGKSTALNMLVGHRRLAFVSKTPGRTQLINFFRTRNEAFLVDLPGYGYAKVPAELQHHWEGLLSRYLQTRKPLLGLVVIMDIRHVFTPLDCQLLDWFRPTGKPVHILLTKADKLSRSQSLQSLQKAKEFAASAEYTEITMQTFSGKDGTGVSQLEERLASWLSFAKSEDSKQLLSGGY